MSYPADYFYMGGMWGADVPNDLKKRLNHIKTVQERYAWIDVAYEIRCWHGQPVEQVIDIIRTITKDAGETAKFECHTGLPWRVVARRAPTRQEVDDLKTWLEIMNQRKGRQRNEELEKARKLLQENGEIE